MKKTIEKLFSDEEKKRLGWLLLLILLYRLVFHLVFHPGLILYNSDSVTYFTKGFFDLYRTPVYPILLKSFRSISENDFLDYLIYFQQIISFVSVIAFYHCATKMIRNKYLLMASVLFYGCFHFTLLQNVNINPESLCISGSVFMLYFFMRAIQSPSAVSFLLMGIFPLLLVMLKPTYLILLPLVILFLILIFFILKEKRKMILYGFLGSMITLSGIWGYCKMNEKVNGEFALTKIYLDNSLGNIILSGAYEEGGDEELIALIESKKDETDFTYYNAVYAINNESMDHYKESYEKFPAYLESTADMDFSSSVPDTDNFEKERIDNFISNSKSSDIYKTYIWKRAKRMLLDYYPFTILLILQIFLIVYLFWKKKIILWLPLFCIGFIFAQAITIVIGGIEDWNRLLLPTLPFIFFTLFYFLHSLISLIKKEESGQITF